MENSADELLAIADREETLAALSNEFETVLQAMMKAVETVGKAWGGSWLGYQSRVYYRDLKPPPAGVHFSSEWGFMEMGWIDGATTGDWEEVIPTQVESHIRRLAGDPDLAPAHELAAQVLKKFEDVRQVHKLTENAADCLRWRVFLVVVAPSGNGRNGPTRFRRLRRNAL